MRALSQHANDDFGIDSTLYKAPSRATFRAFSNRPQAPIRKVDPPCLENKTLIDWTVCVIVLRM